jgi:hypothetical protein
MEPRKIILDTSIYHPLTGASYGGDPNCEHDYPEKPDIDEDEYACWICTKCRMKRCYEVHD